MTDCASVFNPVTHAVMATYKPYEIPKSNTNITDQDILDALDKIAKQFDNQGNVDMAKGIRKYIGNRQDYIKSYNGMYAQIAGHDVTITDKTTLSDDDVGFRSKLKGLLLKVGHEIEQQHVQAMYTRMYNAHVATYTMPISCGDRSSGDKVWISNQDAVVDTGCTRTTLDLSVLHWIRQVKPFYSTTTERIDVVGGKHDVETSSMDIDLCNVPHTNVKVNFADLSGRVALIGTDLLNSGKLDLECGTRISFTRH